MIVLELAPYLELDIFNEVVACCQPHLRVMDMLFGAECSVLCNV